MLLASSGDRQDLTVAPFCSPWKAFAVVADLDFQNWGMHPLGTTHCPHFDPVLPHLTISGSFEIHNRAELAASLGLARGATHSDAVLILYAWARWGASLPEHLEGQFSFVLQDHLHRRLFACVDHLGSIPLLYRTHGTRIFVAGDMVTMLRTPECPRELNLSVLHVVSYPESLPAAPGETLHKGISALPPGHFLLADTAGVRLQRYWTLSIRPELVPAKEDQIYERARHLVELAVANRLAGKKRVAIMYSGGLDSSALAVVAANYLRGKGQTLLALGAVNDPANSEVPDERPFMEKLRGFENIEFQYVDSAGQGPFDNIEDPVQFESCARFPVLRYLFRSVSLAAVSQGADVLLNGAGGELGISGIPVAPLMEHATAFRWPTLARELRCAGAARRVSGLRVLASEARNYYRKPNSGSVFFLSPGFAEMSEMRRNRTPPPWPNSRDAHLRSLLNSLDRCAIPASLPAEFILGCARPLRDKNLLEYCLAVPSRFKLKNGYSRFLIRKAFEPMLPKEMAWRSGKMWASPDYNWRYNARIGKAKEFVHAIQKTDPVREIVDVPRLEQAVRPVDDLWTRSRQPKSHRVATSSVPETIHLINFLRQFPPFIKGDFVG